MYYWGYFYDLSEIFACRKDHLFKSRERENLAIKGNVSKDQYQSGEVKY